jgi:hypothetical protein
MKDSYKPFVELKPFDQSPLYFKHRSHPTKMRQQTFSFKFPRKIDNQSTSVSLLIRICSLLISGYQIGRYFAILLKKNLVKLQILERKNE